MNQPFTQVYLNRSIRLLLATVGKVSMLLFTKIKEASSKGRVITMIFSIVDSVDISGLRYISFLHLAVVGPLPRDRIHDY